MLEIGSVCSIPASAETRTPRSEQIAIGWGPRESAAKAAAFRIWSPEYDANVEAAINRAIEHIKEGAAITRDSEVGCVEGDGQPDTVPSLLDRLADASKSRKTID
jgi:hypothetical protein